MEQPMHLSKFGNEHKISYIERDKYSVIPSE